MSENSYGRGMGFSDDRYGFDVLDAGARRARASAAVPVVDAERDLVVEDAATGFCGAVVGFERGTTVSTCASRTGAGRPASSRCEPSAFLLDGAPVTLRRPPARAAAPARTASGSVAPASSRARVARASRIFVEGIHDAALVERIWGDDLRAEGVVVVGLDGLDNLDRCSRSSSPGRRAGGRARRPSGGGQQESRLTREVGPHVLVCGHPFIDIWEAVKPRCSASGSGRGCRARGVEGRCLSRLRWGTPTDGWRRVNRAVSDYRDMRVELLRSVEELIDFVTAASGDG